MKIKKLSSEEVEKEVKKFVKEFKTCIIGLVNNNSPFLSSIPIVKKNHLFYAYISKTAPHFDYMKESNKAQIMFVEDENKMKNSFLRKRLFYNVSIKFIEDDENIFSKFKKNHGEIIDVLRKLDFNLVEFSIIDGKIILGAGQAYFLDSNEKFLKQDLGEHKKG